MSTSRWNLPPARGTTVSYEGVTIYVAAADVPDELRPHRETTFRGQRWFVLESSSGEAMRTIRLYRERT